MGNQASTIPVYVPCWMAEQLGTLTKHLFAFLYIIYLLKCYLWCFKFHAQKYTHQKWKNWRVGLKFGKEFWFLVDSVLTSKRFVAQVWGWGWAPRFLRNQQHRARSVTQHHPSRNEAQIKRSCHWKSSLSFNCRENLSEQAQQKVSQGKGLPPLLRGKGMTLGSLNLLVGLWYSTSGFIDLHHGDVGWVFLSGGLILSWDVVTLSEVPLSARHLQFWKQTMGCRTELRLTLSCR